MVSMDYDGWDCKILFRTSSEGRLDGICSKTWGTTLLFYLNEKTYSNIIHVGFRMRLLELL